MNRIGHWTASALTALGVVLVLTSLGYWLLQLRGGVERSFPTPKPTVAERLADQVSDSLTSVTAAIRGVRTVPVPILTYHYIRPDIDPTSDPLGYGLSIPPDLFAQQLDAIQKAGYTTVTPKQFLQGAIDDSSIILSFDDGYRDFYTTAFPALQRRGMRAVSFVVSGFLDDTEGRYMTRDQVREVFDGGIEIGAHTVTHPNLTSLEPVELQQELLESRFTLEKLTEDRVTAFAYPSGEYNDQVTNMASFAGFRFAVTTHAGVARLADNHLELPRLSILPDDTPARLIERIQQAKQSSTTEPTSADAET